MTTIWIYVDTSKDVGDPDHLAIRRFSTSRPHGRSDQGAPRGHSRAIHWPSDHLKRAAAAIREKRSVDCIVLAKAELEAAIRNEADLLMLMPPEQSAKSRPQQLFRCPLYPEEPTSAARPIMSAKCQQRKCRPAGLEQVGAPAAAVTERKRYRSVLNRSASSR